MAYGSYSCLFALTLCVTGAWATLTFDALRNTALVQHGETTLKLIDQWIALIKRIEPLSDQEKLQFTNNFFNSAVKWVADQDNWQQEDYWATPLETLSRRRGDCEDYSISKYITLVLADTGGQAAHHLRGSNYGKRCRAQPSPHGAVYPQPRSEPLILDNIARDIVRGSCRDLTPAFGFNTGVITVGHGTDPRTRNRLTDCLAGATHSQK